MIINDNIEGVSHLEVQITFLLSIYEYLENMFLELDQICTSS